MVLSAISADDFEQLRPLFRIDGVPEAETTEIANLGADSVKQLREELAYLKIDLAKATFLRVVVTGDHIHLFDVFLEANGQVYKTHFSVMVTRAGYSLLGIANWIVSETK